MRYFLAALFFGASSCGLLIGSLGGALLGIHALVVADAVTFDPSKVTAEQMMHLPLVILAEYPINYRG